MNSSFSLKKSEKKSTPTSLQQMCAKIGILPGRHVKIKDNFYYAGCCVSVKKRGGDSDGFIVSDILLDEKKRFSCDVLLLDGRHKGVRSRFIKRLYKNCMLKINHIDDKKIVLESNKGYLTTLLYKSMSNILSVICPMNLYCQKGDHFIPIHNDKLTKKLILAWISKKDKFTYIEKDKKFELERLYDNCISGTSIKHLKTDKMSGEKSILHLTHFGTIDTKCRDFVDTFKRVSAQNIPNKYVKVIKKLTRPLRRLSFRPMSYISFRTIP